MRLMVTFLCGCANTSVEQMTTPPRYDLNVFAMDTLTGTMRNQVMATLTLEFRRRKIRIVTVVCVNETPRGACPICFLACCLSSASSHLTVLYVTVALVYYTSRNTQSRGEWMAVCLCPDLAVVLCSPHECSQRQSPGVWHVEEMLFTNRVYTNQCLNCGANDETDVHVRSKARDFDASSSA